MRNLKAESYLNSMNEVLYFVFNPMGLGRVKIHLIPARKQNKQDECFVIFNGRYFLSLNYSLAILVTIFLRRINFFDGNEVSESKLEMVINGSLKEYKEIFPFQFKGNPKQQLQDFLDSVILVAKGDFSSFSTLTDFADKIKAPINMNLLLSPVTKNGNWNCNQYCTYCYKENKPQANESELSSSDWLNIIDKLWSEVYVSQLTFADPEPFFRADLFELISYSKNFITTLETNGIVLEHKSICESLYNASLDSIVITLYSSNEDLHNRLVGVNGFKSTIQGIKNALSVGLNVTVETPIVSNDQDYISTLTFLRNIGVRNVSCSSAKSISKTKISLNAVSFMKIFTESAKFCSDTGMHLSLSSPSLISEEGLENLGIDIPCCGASLYYMAISPNGDVIPCKNWFGDEATLGNILTDDWDTIWNSPKCKQVRNHTISKQYICPFNE